MHSRRSSDDEAEDELDLLDLHEKHCEQRLSIWRDENNANVEHDDDDDVSITWFIIATILLISVIVGKLSLIQVLFVQL